MKRFNVLNIIILMVCLIFSVGCGQKENQTLFSLLSPEETGIHFSNMIAESDTLNILKEEYIYNGGGVAVGDFNNDGLPDVYFTGNMVSNQLYLNKGNMKFEDITKKANVTGEGRWCAGVSVVDINQDGWLDIYVAVTLHKDSARRKNLLYINNGVGNEGLPTFTESAAKFGIADSGNTTQAAFFDYDNDGDLDLYLLTNVIDTKVPGNYRNKITDGTALNNDRLYRNNGNGSFSNVTKEAGILIEGFGLGITISDINLDGWQDIYITNDYLSNDLLYVNNKNGTFSNKINEYLNHQSHSAMGNDVVDINNDGLVDIIALDMLPESNKRKKQMMGRNNYVDYINNEKYDYQYQYVRNTLQLNNGFTPKGHPTFSEIGQLSGVYQTDWSWAPLVADFDNDGYRDIIVTNGFPKDVTDKDFASYRSGPAGGVASDMQLQDSIPVVKVANYAFRNNGDLTFTNKTQDWGLSIPSFSNGAVYADLDNDGDLDFVVNNINDSAFVYENQLYDLQKDGQHNHYLRIKLAGTPPNVAGLGTKISIKYGEGKQQFYEHSPTRGYLSTVENAAHFGLGPHEGVDSIQVFWPDGKSQLLLNVQADQEIVLMHAKAEKTPVNDLNQELHITLGQSLFQEVSADYDIQYKHKEEDRIDFNLQRTLPHKYTQGGPGIAVGDVDGNGYDDFYVGGSAGKKGVFFLQSREGKFSATTDNITYQGEKTEEDMGSLMFDADNDGDLDLYVVSGSYEFEPGSPALQDRLYINTGKGQFELDTTALPDVFTSGSCVKAADYDQDGDLDLFLGGRVIPGQYPLPPRSYILRNDGGKFTDVTAQVCPELEKPGMVTDALWTDFDKDGQVDLVIAGEWMPITFYRNTNSTFKDITSSTGLAAHVGWWNSLTAGDFDNDGDIDYVAGNLGLNTNYKASEKQPLSVYAKDFDDNGSIDPVLVTYLKAEDGNMAPFPMHARDDLSSQIQRMRKQYQRFEPYGLATINDVLSAEDMKNALVLQATHFASSYIENLGNGKFKMTPLPIEAQFAPIFGMLGEDFDQDGNLDILLVGNNYATEVFTGRYDAFIGLYLKGDGKGNFLPKKVAESGFFVEGDAKGIAKLQGSNGESLILVTQNQDSLKIFSTTNSIKSRTIQLEPMDAWAEISFANGKKQRKEFYYGSTYLSQSARVLTIGENVKSVFVYDYNGKKRQISLEPELVINKND